MPIIAATAAVARRLEARDERGLGTVLAVGAGTVVLKAVGPVGVAGRELPPRVATLLSMIAPAILAALVVAETFAHGRSLVVDARSRASQRASVAVLLRAPLWARRRRRRRCDRARARCQPKRASSSSGGRSASESTTRSAAPSRPRSRVTEFGMPTT